MGYRHKDIGPRLALWTLVALGDIVLLLVSAGLSAPVAVLTVAALVVAGLATWRLAGGDNGSRSRRSCRGSASRSGSVSAARRGPVTSGTAR